MTTGRTTPTSKPRTTPKAKQPTVHFDIAQAEAEVDAQIAEEHIDPYLVRAKDGTIVEFVDPRNLDVFVAASLDIRDPYTTYRTLIEDEEQYRAFVAEGFKPGVAKMLFEAYKDHYKGVVVDLGN